MVHDFLVNNDLSSVCAFWGVRCFLVLKSGCFFGYHMDIFSVAKQTNSSLWCETPPRSSGKWRLMGIPCFKHIYTIYIYIILWWLLLGGGSSQMLPVFHPCLFFNPTHDFIPPHSRTALPCFANLSRRRLSASHATSAVESWTLLCTPWLYLRMFGGEHCKERWSNVVKDPTCADP